MVTQRKSLRKFNLQLLVSLFGHSFIVKRLSFISLFSLVSVLSCFFFRFLSFPVLSSPNLCFSFHYVLSSFCNLLLKRNKRILFLHITCFIGEARWPHCLVRSTPDRRVRVRALAGDIVLCSWARHFTPTVTLSTQVYKWVPFNCWGNLTNLGEVTCDGLASRPGEVEILIPASCYRNRGKLRQQ